MPFEIGHSGMRDLCPNSGAVDGGRSARRRRVPSSFSGKVDYLVQTPYLPDELKMLSLVRRESRALYTDSTTEPTTYRVFTAFDLIGVRKSPLIFTHTPHPALATKSYRTNPRAVRPRRSR